ncbi:ankyrin repeat-containing domain protein, partial [Trichophaea hybrida]
LHLAAAKGYTDIIKLLLERGADIEVTSDENKTALYLAVEANLKNIVEQLLDHRADPTRRKSGQNALHLAAAEGYTDIIKLLLERDADIEATSDENKTALYLAAYGEHAESISALIDGGALTDKRDQDGRTLLYWSYGYSDSADALKTLLAKGVNPNILDHDGHSDLYYTIERQNNNGVEALLEARADVNLRGPIQETPLCLALKSGQSDIARRLLNVDGIDIQASDICGQQAIHLAARNGDLDVLNILLKRRVSAHVSTKDGKSPLHFAAQSGNLGVFNLLLEQSASVAAITKKGKLSSTTRPNLAILQ